MLILRFPKHNDGPLQRGRIKGRDFYEEGKQFEDRFYQPKIRAEKHRRDALKGSNSNRETA
ncbi:hypothetical protein TRICHSKD4_1607 [Roseibium sp. TrichSKD4]|nr:hypothetical protein TRICHSKD4_1607 [Roseibium sp. TrichSKD4]